MIVTSPLARFEFIKIIFFSVRFTLLKKTICGFCHISPQKWRIQVIMVKKVLSVTIDKKILEIWRQYAEEECVNSSKLIEKMLKEHLKKRGKNVK
jgi:hypothetical protein